MTGTREEGEINDMLPNRAMRSSGNGCAVNSDTLFKQWKDFSGSSYMTLMALFPIVSYDFLIS